MKELYKLILVQLRTIEEIKMIDFDYGQLDADTVAYPCALLKLNSGNKDIDEAGSQEKRWTVRLRLGFDSIGAKTSSLEHEQVLDRSLAWSATVAEVYSLLQGAQLEDYAPFECTAEGQEDRADGKYVYSFTFNTTHNHYID